MFTPIETTLGSLLLHLSTATLLLNDGRILDASSVLSGALTRPSTTNVPILVGMILVPFVVTWFSAPWSLLLLLSFPGEPRTLATVTVTTCLGMLAGWGTKHRQGSHPDNILCGIPGSFPCLAIQTAVSFTTALVAANLFTSNAAPPCSEGPCYVPSLPSTRETVSLTLFTVSLLGTSVVLPYLLQPSARGRALIGLLSGLEYSLGLLISGLASPRKVLGFFSLLEPAKFDPSLALVVVFSVLPNLLRNILRGFTSPPSLAKRFWLPTTKVRGIDRLFLARAVASGLGWGLQGIYPGSGIFRAVVQPGWGVPWIVGFMVGQQLLPSEGGVLE